MLQRKYSRNSDKCSSKLSVTDGEVYHDIQSITKKGRTLLNFSVLSGLSGAEVCESCRFRQELSNEYFFANINFDRAENERLEVPDYR